MKLKKYNEFIIESNSNGFNSLGEWVESLIDDDYVKNIISRYTKDIDPDIELSNAINILDERTKYEIKSQIDNYLENGIEEKDPTIVASTDIEELTEAEITKLDLEGVEMKDIKKVYRILECETEYQFSNN